MKFFLPLLSILPFLLCSCDSDEADAEGSSSGFEIVTYSGPVEEEETPRKVTTTIERKPAEPSDSMSKVIAANTEAPKAIPMEKIKRVQPVAKPVPGKPGFVFNPFTDKIVDVRGLPPGQLTRDPTDPNPDHKFRIPNP